jgi:Domain of unknown function (DUF4262)
VIERFEGRELDESERKVLGHVGHHGWSVTNIREEDGAPGWSFTIGLFENFGHPEVAIFGMPSETRHSILNWIGKNVREGKPFTSGREHDWVLEERNCWSRDVDKLWYKDLFGWAIWFYAGTDFPVVQCIWPAKDGSYPWEGNSPFLTPQPLLFEQELLSARMVHFVNDRKLTTTEWPFADDPHHGVFVSRCVFEDNAPIVRAVHDREGDWQFIGPIDDPDEDGCKLSCFHCVVEKDPSIRSLAQLLPGWEARRNDPGADWELNPVEEGE